MSNRLLAAGVLAAIGVGGLLILLWMMIFKPF